MSIPFKINFFRQVEIFQEILKLDKQFERMLKGWQENKSKGIDRVYPLWEMQKKILLWTTKHHKYLGSPLLPRYFTNEESDERFLKDAHISRAEVLSDGASGAHSLSGLVSMDLARSKDGGAVISKDGLVWGSLIADLYNIIEDKESDFRKHKLTMKKGKSVGYHLMYYATVLVIWDSVLFLCLNILEITNLLNTISSLLNTPYFLKRISSVVIILPVILYFISFILIVFSWGKIYFEKNGKKSFKLIV